MAKKKASQPELTPEEAALTERIDAMMDPKRPDPPSGSAAKGSEPLDIFKDIPDSKRPVPEVKPDPAPAIASAPTSSAPTVPGDLLKDLPETTHPDEPVPEPKVEAVEPKPPEAEPPEQEPAPEQPAETDPLNNAANDKAVDEIMAKESDDTLAETEAPAETPEAEPEKPTSGGLKAKLKAILKSRRTWLFVLLLIVIIMAVPMTRYKVLGLAIKKPVTITVVDTETNRPVSNAVVSIGTAEAITDGNGVASLRAPTGKAILKIEKQYYAAYSQPVFVGLTNSTVANSKMVATGRQVPITIVNTITGKPISGAEVKVLDATAKTNGKGRATIVVPATGKADQAKVSLKGYNSLETKLEVTDQEVKANSFKLTPSGKVYFLSNRGQTIDVVKANLDGTGREVVLEGTGQEDPKSTSLLASHDWKYVVLKAKRDTAKPALYLIDTSDDEIVAFERNNSDITTIGWHGHRFVYDLMRTDIPNSQAGRQVIKSYDAAHGEPSQLDSSQAQTNPAGYIYQRLANYYLVNDTLTYTTEWISVPQSDTSIQGKSATIRTVQSDGTNKKDQQTFAAKDVTYFEAVQSSPQTVLYRVNLQDGKTDLYKYERGAVVAADNLDAGSFNAAYPTYLVSPSANRSAWSESRDGKRTLFIGNAQAEDKQPLTELNDYAPYGWFTDDYILISKDQTSLYVTTAGNSKQVPLKISDYYRPVN